MWQSYEWCSHVLIQIPFHCLLEASLSEGRVTKASKKRERERERVGEAERWNIGGSRGRLRWVGVRKKMRGDRGKAWETET